MVLKNTIRACVLGRPGGTQTVFVSRISLVNADEIVTPEDILRARVIGLAVRAQR